MSASRSTPLLLLAIAACDAGPAYRGLPADADLGGRLPVGFLFGAATAAHQIEGQHEDDWSAWERGSFADGRPHIRSGDTSAVAAGSWTHWPQDVAALRELGANAYRLSLEWSRLEPAPGVWDATAEANYRAQLEALRRAGITPLVTLHHYTLPSWVAEQGGWEWGGIVAALESLAAHVAERFGDVVDLYCTINEPNVAAYEAYLWGAYPPGVEDIVRTAQVYATMLRAHAAMAMALRSHDAVDVDGDGREAFVGLALHVAIFEPASASPLDGLVAAIADDATTEMVPRAVATGRITLDIPGSVHLDERVPELLGSFDYFGVNYYTRYLVRFDPTDPGLSEQYFGPRRPTSDLGYETYPEGLYRTLVRLSRWGWPIYVLENGIADASGTARPEYLRAHLWELTQALAAGVDVRGYFHWALMDNFEWEHGYFGGHTGLFRVDRADPQLTRVATPAVETFRQVARQMGLAPTP